MGYIPRWLMGQEEGNGGPLGRFRWERWERGEGDGRPLGRLRCGTQAVRPEAGQD